MAARTPPSFQTTVLLTVVPLTALTAVLTAGVSYTNDRRAADRHAAAVAGQAAHRVADHVTDLLDETTAFAGWCAAVPAPTDLTADGFRPLFDTLARAFADRPHLTLLGLALDRTGEGAAFHRGPDGAITYWEVRQTPAGDRRSVGRPVVGGVIGGPAADRPAEYDPRGRPFFAQAREARRPTWIDSYPLEQGGRGVTFAIPVLAGERVDRVWNVSIDAEAIADCLRRVQADLGGGYAFVVEERHDGTRQLLAHPNPAALTAGDPAADPLLVPTRAGEPHGRAAAPAVIAGPADALTAVAATPGGDRPRWLVASVIPRAGLLADARRAAVWQAGLLAGLVAGVTVLAGWLVRRLNRPLARLQAQATAVAGGERPAPIPETGPKEFRALAAAFNHMAAAVAAREADLVRSEAAARAARDRHELHRQQLPLAVIDWDLDSRVSGWNPAAERIFGYPAAEALGQDYRFIIPPEVRPAVEEVRAAVFAERGGWRSSNPNVTRDGRRIQCEWYNAVLADATGRVVGATSVVEDVTARTAAEAALRQLTADLERRVADRTAQLAAANKELEAFAYSVSHDLRAPLRSIDGFSRALLEDYADRLDAEGRDYLARVRAGSLRMGVLIDDLLMLSRMARADLLPTEIDLSALARKVVEGLRAAAPYRAVAVHVEPDVRARGDLNLVRVVLENLLGNAWKYTAHAADARIEFGATTADGARVYFVRDNGAGFDLAYAHKLFKPFQRLHRTDEFEGHGIGLATVLRVVSRHGGRVWGEGRVDGGATFSFTLGPNDRIGATSDE